MLWFALRSLVVFLLAWVITGALRRRSASVRHLIWLAAFIAVIAMPAFGGIAAQVEITTPPAAAPILRPLAPQLIKSPDPGRSPIRIAAETIAAPDAAIPTEPTKEASVDPYALIAALYWTGLAIVASRYLLAARTLRRAVRHSRLLQIVPPGIALRLVENGYLASPATFGWPRATILLPEESQSWPEERRNAALAHEIAHIERADWVWQCVAFGVCAVQWFNPLAWFAAARLRAEAEGAADDTVLCMGLAPSRYAQDLLEVAKTIRQDTVLAVPIARPGGIASRIRAILSPNRDRRPASHPAHLAAGTGTLFAASILGGLGLSAAVSSGPFAAQDPFQTPLLFKGTQDVIRPGSSVIIEDGSLGIYQVQVRPQGGKEEGWDSMGRLTSMVVASRIPRTPVIPGRKVREIAIGCPPTRLLSVRLPSGAEVLQVAREKRYAIVTASFPADAKVSPIEMGYPRAPGAVMRALALKPVSGPHGKRLSPNLAWFAVPSGRQELQYRIFDQAGKEVPVKGQFSRQGEEENFVAVDATQAGAIARIEECLLVPDWRTFSPLLLDPAPKQRSRSYAPEPKVALPGGAELAILRIESQTPGEPFRSWAIDGGTPRVDYDRSRSSYASVDQSDYVGRQVVVSVTGLPKGTALPSLTWIVDSPMRSRSSGLGSWNGTTLGDVAFTVPKDQKEARLQIDYAYEAYREVVNEPLGGPGLKSRARLDPDTTYNDQPSVEVQFDPPQAVQKMDLVMEAYDIKGKLIALQSTSGPSYDHIANTVDYHRFAHFEIRSPKQIARLRLKARPFHRVTLPPLPMHPANEARR